MTSIFKGLFLISTLILSSCSSKDSSRRTIYLSAKFKLSNAAFNETYKPTSDPALFNRIPGNINCKTLFDIDNSFVIYNVKIVDGKPIGYGSLNISFSDKTILDKKCEYFEYVCNYDKVYGGVINQTEETKIDYIGVQSCRSHYHFTRMECRFPEIENGRRIILEFNVYETYDEPSEFNYDYNI